MERRRIVAAELDEQLAAELVLDLGIEPDLTR